MAVTGYTNAIVTPWDTLQFSWSRTDYSIPNNKSSVYWELKLIAGEYGYIYSIPLRAWAVNVNGTEYSGSVSVAINNWQTRVLASGTTEIPHNADGSKTFSYSFSQVFNIDFNGWVGTISGSGTGTLDTIPRQAALTSAPHFTDEDNPTITYSNPAGNAVDSLQACIASADGHSLYAAYRDIDKNGTSYTFNLTEAERGALRWATINSNTLTVKFYVTTVIGGVTYYSTLDKILTIANAQPVLNPSVKDVGTLSTQLTGDANKIIKGFNYLEVSSGAAAVKGSSIKSQRITCGGLVIDGASGGFSNAESAAVVFSATDSRGNTTTQTVNKTLIDYIRLTCDLAAANPTTDGEAAIEISGNYYNGSFGAVNNSLAVAYRYKENDGAYSEWIAAEATISGNTYKAAATLTGLNYRSAYTIQARAIDAVGNISGVPVLSVEKKVKTIPVFDWGENDFNVNGTLNINNIPVAAHIVEQGEENGWFYRKYSNGYAECWKIYYGSGINAAANNYSGFYYSSPITEPFPFEFSNFPIVTVDGGSADYINFVRVFGSYKEAASFVVCGLIDVTSTDITVHIRAIGKYE